MGQGPGYVYVVRNSKLRKTAVRYGKEDGVHVEITSGLEPDATVVVRYNGAIADGVEVQAEPLRQTQLASPQVATPPAVKAPGPGPADPPRWGRSCLARPPTDQGDPMPFARTGPAQTSPARTARVAGRRQQRPRHRPGGRPATSRRRLRRLGCASRPPDTAAGLDPPRLCRQPDARQRAQSGGGHLGAARHRVPALPHRPSRRLGDHRPVAGPRLYEGRDARPDRRWRHRPAGDDGAFDLSTYLPGDVNGDGKVDSPDLQAFAPAYLTKSDDAFSTTPMPTRTTTASSAWATPSSSSATSSR